MSHPTKKQKRLLDFIAKFIDQHGYAPSYREIKNGLGYGSVATVAVHIDNLVKAGYIRKKDHSARSIEVAGQKETHDFGGQVAPDDAKWLVEKIDILFSEYEKNPDATETDIDKLYVLVGTLKVLGLDGAFQAFSARLTNIKKS